MRFKLFICTQLIIYVLAPCSFAQSSFEILSNEILKHYRTTNDTLAEKSAMFLLENMKYHFFWDSEILEAYYNDVKKISSEISYPKNINAYQQLNTKIGDLSFKKQIAYDYDYLTYKEIIQHIDDAISLWKNGKWAKHLTFNQFCEFLLPYKVGLEKPELNRSEYQTYFLNYISSELLSDDRSRSSFWAAKCLCEGIKKRNYRLNDKSMPNSDIEMPMSVLYNMNMGACYHLAKFTTYLMRACGIPVSVDFTPQWANKSGRHTWNGLLMETNKIVPFVGCDVYPGQQGHLGEHMPKIFRYTYAYQPQSAYALGKKYGEVIPDVFNTPFIKDVSKEYQEGIDISIKINTSYYKNKIVFLAVFDNQNWQPVDYAIVDDNGNANFTNIGKGILYTPIFWSNHGGIPCGEPFFVKENGDIKYFIPNFSKKQSCVFERKYPLQGHFVDYAKKLVGGRFEASDSSNFNNPIVLYKITNIPKSWENSYDINADSSFKYYRFIAPANSKCDVAEISFSYQNKTLTNYTRLCDDMRRNKVRLGNIDDSNMLTFYESAHNRNAWVGIKFDRNEKVDKIILTPRNDANHVTKGHLYRLDYFYKGKLNPVKVMFAEADEIMFDNIPNNALLILHDLTSGFEERYFSINKDNSLTWY